MGVVSDLVRDVPLPRMVKVRQILPRPSIPSEEVPGVIRSLLEPEKFASRVKPGMKICITCGSRGMANIPLIVGSIVSFCRERGAIPFVIPAMGSHGGATAEGQREILASLGVTEETVGCPIVSCMDTVVVGHSPEGLEVRIDKNAAQADGIIVFGRIKAHTCFRGPYESGLMKMMTIGMGKQHGAESCHSAGFKHMAYLVPTFARVIMKNAPVLFGVATLENAFDETYKLVALTPEEIDSEEPKLLEESKRYLQRIVFPECDVLVVDQVGKNISGEGMDPNVSGTFATPYASGGIKAQKRCVLSLTEATHGSFHGIGFVDAISRRVFREMDFEKSYPNAITSTELGFAKIPIIMKNDRETIQVCIQTCVEVDKKNIRLIRIQDTLNLEYIWISEAMLAEARANPEIEIVGEPEPIPFDADGDIAGLRKPADTQRLYYR